MTRKSKNFFAKEEVMVALTTAPAGLGHVRVTEALRGALDKGVRPEVVGLKHPKLQILHRIASRNPYLRGAMETFQTTPALEELFTKSVRATLRRGADEPYERLRDLVKRRRPKPKVLVVVATHHSLAHQIAAVKERLAEELSICVVLAVVVTDDSPQKMWGIVGADYLFVPSGSTKDKLLEYMNTIGGEIPEVIVGPYPVSVDFCEPLSESELKRKKAQVSSSGVAKMQVVIPISGAAVQLKYFKEMITVLCESGQVKVTVVARDSKHTRKFLRWCQERACVEVVAKIYDRDVVAAYDKVYKRKVVAVEVTKPSEQAFKALIDPSQRGGPVMLFSHPVGRQEMDNIAFLRRHGLLPSRAEESEAAIVGVGSVDEGILEKAKKWRGLRLPRSGKAAGEAILRWKQVGILKSMVNFSGFMDHAELSCYGSEMLWARLAVEVKKQCKLILK